jgi:hypothetical protein
MAAPRPRLEPVTNAFFPFRWKLSKTTLFLLNSLTLRVGT